MRNPKDIKIDDGPGFTVTALKCLPVPNGNYARRWYRCRKCGRVYHYDYLPYSLSVPILTVPCAHQTFRDLECLKDERAAMTEAFIQWRDQ